MIITLFLVNGSSLKVTWLWLEERTFKLYYTKVAKDNVNAMYIEVSF